jgi:hypothetical protein
LDEVFLKINGKTHYLWRAVDQDSNVLDILVQNRRNKQAAKKFFRKLPKGLQYVPRVVITDNLARHPLSIWADPGSLSAQTASPYRSGLPCSSAGSFSGMERGDQKENCRLTPHSSSPIFRFFSLFLPFPQKALPFLCQADYTH